jgi:glutamate-1-semialdehyde 2,1-aminomutase
MASFAATSAPALSAKASLRGSKVGAKNTVRSAVRRNVTTKAAATTSFTTTNSDRIFKEALDLMPGGVSSPVRAFKSVGGGPIVFKNVKGAYAYDVDGNKYIDYVGTWGPAICGHANDEVRLCFAQI